MTGSGEVWSSCSHVIANAEKFLGGPGTLSWPLPCREDPGRYFRESTAAFQFSPLHSFGPFFSESLTEVACSPRAQTLRRPTMHKKTPGQASMHSPHTSPLQGPEVTRGRGDWLPRGTSTWGPKRPQMESRGILQKLETASIPAPHPPGSCLKILPWVLWGRVRPRRRPGGWARIPKYQAKHPFCR